MVRITHRLTCILVVAVSMTGACSKRTPPGPPPPPTARSAAAASSPAPAPRPAAVDTAARPANRAPASAALSEDELFAQKTLAQLNAERPLHDAFFDYDQSTLREDARRSLQANARWLSRWTSARITLQGHADERGTAEYNLALGERRANAVKGYLVSLGVAPGRIQTVGIGKESPFCVDRAEHCYEQNRRGHFIISAK